ncbi:TPA: O-antigen polymerase [Streptococcus suis]
MRITKNDLLNPAVVFSLIFLIQVSICLMALFYLNLIFHMETLLILVGSNLIFLFFTMVLYRNKEKKIEDNNILSTLNIQRIFTIVAIVLFFIVIIIQYQRLGRIAAVSGLGGASLSEQIAFYDFLIKFDPARYNRIGIYLPEYISDLIPILQSFAYIVAYKSINNYILLKKVELLDVFLMVLFVVQLYLTGSRSPIFRLITYMVFIFYILTLKNGYSRFQMKVVIKRIISIAIAVLVLFFVSLSMFGRTNNYNNFHYLFIYLGAPLYNLDVFIQTHSFPIVQEYFGQQSFQSLYNYILPKIGQETYSLILPYVQYSSVYGLGNVYTTFYQFLYDFGYLGLIILTIGISGFYTTSYKNLLNFNKWNSNFSILLFIYAYLFNDLIMLIFSNRFYETILSVNTLKIFIFTFIIKSLLFDNGINIWKYRIVLKLR